MSESLIFSLVSFDCDCATRKVVDYIIAAVNFVADHGDFRRRPLTFFFSHFKIGYKFLSVYRMREKTAEWRHREHVSDPTSIDAPDRKTLHTISFESGRMVFPSASRLPKMAGPVTSGELNGVLKKAEEICNSIDHSLYVSESGYYGEAPVRSKFKWYAVKEDFQSDLLTLPVVRQPAIEYDAVSAITGVTPTQPRKKGLFGNLSITLGLPDVDSPRRPLERGEDLFQRPGESSSRSAAQLSYQSPAYIPLGRPDGKWNAVGSNTPRTPPFSVPVSRTGIAPSPFQVQRPTSVDSFSSKNWNVHPQAGAYTFVPEGASVTNWGRRQHYY